MENILKYPLYSSNNKASSPSPVKKIGTLTIEERKVKI